MTLTITRSVLGASPNNGVLAMALLRNELFVTRRGETNVSVYDAASLQLRRRIRIEIPAKTPADFGSNDNLWAYGLAVCPVNNYLYVADYSRKLIYRVDLSTDSVVRWDSATYPRGLSVNSRNNLVITFDDGSIGECTSNGTLLRRIEDVENYLWQAIETINGTLLVNRRGPNHGIAELTWDALELSSYGKRRESSDIGLRSPRSIVVDSNGYVLVMESYDDNRVRLQVVNPSLTTAVTLPLPANSSLTSPGAMCYDESRGRLYVGEYGDKTRVLAFDHVTNLGALFD